MSLEQAISELKTSIDALNAKLSSANAGAPVVAGKTETKPTKTETKTKAPKHTKDDVAAALGELKEKDGGNGDRAKKLILEVGGTVKLADVPEDKYDALYDAAKKLVEATGDEEL